MKLAHTFYRLPLYFDSERLAYEVAQFSEAEWRPHPQGHKGNSALPLIAVNGDPTNENTKGPMRPTPYLNRCPYLQQALAALDAPIGRTRLMRIEGNGEATAHVDTNYYWSQRVRVHIPTLTYPGVRFLCGEHEVFMPAGECWIFDTWRLHNVLNPDDRPRIHLVADTVGSDSFWGLVAQAERPFDSTSPSLSPPRLAPYQPGQPIILQTETRNFSVVMSPWEMQWLIQSICEDLARSPDGAKPLALDFKTRLERFLSRWRALWARFGEAATGWPDYQAELQRLEADLKACQNQLKLPNHIDAVTVIRHWLLQPALNLDLAENNKVEASSSFEPKPGSVANGKSITPADSTPTPADSVTTTTQTPHLDRPIFIVAAPRSGSTLLFETLARAPKLYTIGGESHQLFEGITALSPEAHQFASNRLTAADATPEVVARLKAAFWAQIRDREGCRPPENGAVRLLEKTPKNALRIPFLAAAFPDARFIYLYREPAESLASIIEAWRSGRFVTYPRLPAWAGPPWSLLLIPNWQALLGQNLAEIAAAQWMAANRQILDDLAALPTEQWCALTYASLLADPQAEIERLCHFAGLTWDQPLTADLPLSRYTLTPPDPRKWQAHAALLEPVLPLVDDIAHRARQVCRTPGYVAPNGRSAVAPIVTQSAGAAAPAPAAATPSSLRSIHTASFPQLLDQLGLSIFVSTYQAGKLVVLRANGEVLNTHFRSLNKPMGLALQGSRLAIGTELEIREFRNIPAVTSRLEPIGRYDACFLPRSTHTTGDIQIRDLAWVGPDLWFVNTRFSCLCTHSLDYSFVPRWRPAFISALAPEDRCHLNGLAVVEGQARYVTALGYSDEPRGWREHKQNGGILLDLASDEVILRGLSMPHSPRWHAGQLWLLNSGEGGVGVVDLNSGRYREVIRLPGFTRGLDFYQRYAFIGLSQVRETAVFSGIPIADLPLSERSCGVWVLDIITGQTVAFMKFEDAVQEIFAVQVAPGLRFPEVLTDDKKLIGSSYVLPDEALQAVPANLK